MFFKYLLVFLFFFFNLHHSTIHTFSAAYGIESQKQQIKEGNPDIHIPSNSSAFSQGSQSDLRPPASSGSSSGSPPSVVGCLGDTTVKCSNHFLWFDAEASCKVSQLSIMNTGERWNMDRAVKQKRHYSQLLFLHIKATSSLMITLLCFILLSLVNKSHRSLNSFTWGRLSFSTQGKHFTLFA